MSTPKELAVNKLMFWNCAGIRVSSPKKRAWQDYTCIPALFVKPERRRERGHLAGRKWETATSIGEMSLNEAVKLSDGNGFKREQ